MARGDVQLTSFLSFFARSTTISVEGKEITLTSEHLTIQRKTFQQYSPFLVLRIRTLTSDDTVREFTPNVIEPSFGIGRILYSLLEHSYWAREKDIARGVSLLC